MIVGGKLRCGGERGIEVHAGSFLRERRIVLDSALLQNKAERERILLHEIFHFVWWKLGRPRRLQYEHWLAGEMSRGVRGEMGWSAEFRKTALCPADWERRSRHWREYLSESFCDTAPARLLGLTHHDEISLGARDRERRLHYLEDLLLWNRLNI